jgi:hypothetical protein
VFIWDIERNRGAKSAKNTSVFLSTTKHMFKEDHSLSSELPSKIAFSAKNKTILLKMDNIHRLLLGMINTINHTVNRRLRLYPWA